MDLVLCQDCVFGGTIFLSKHQPPHALPHRSLRAPQFRQKRGATRGAPQLHRARLAIAPWDSFNFPSPAFATATRAHIIEDTPTTLPPQSTAGYTFPAPFAFNSVLTALAQAAAQAASPAHSRKLPAAITEQEGMFGGGGPKCTPCTQLGCSGNLDPAGDACTTCGFFSILKKSKPNPSANGDGAGAGRTPIPQLHTAFNDPPGNFGSPGGLFNTPGAVNTWPPRR
jgi:hypothetical protein